MKPRSRRSQAMGWVRRVARALAGFQAEVGAAQRRLLEDQLHPDYYLTDRDRAPASYGEFLSRSPRALWREPSARQRECGRCAPSRC